MRVTVKVGEVSLTVDGLDYTRRQVVALLGQVASVAVALADGEEEDRQAFGFSLGATVERVPEDVSEPIYYDDEE